MASETAPPALQRAWQRIDADRLLQETYEFVSVPSPTGQEAAFAEVYASCLDDIGLDVTVDPEWPDSPSVIARWHGNADGPVLQLDGHTDTITVAHQAPELDIGAGIIRGRGAADMKGGLAGIAHALRALRESGAELRGSVLVTAHGLHEAPGGDQRTLRSLLRKGVAGDAALVAELSNDGVPIAAKGMSIFRITISRPGGVMHEVELSRRELNPLHGLRHVLELLDRKAAALEAVAVPLLGTESIFVGEVHGGDFYNRVPEHVEVLGTRRYAVPVVRADIEAELVELCGEVSDRTGLNLSVTLQEVGVPYALTGTEDVVRAVRQGFHWATGHDLPLVGAGAVGNGADFVSFGIPAVYHGVNQATAHSDAEYVTGADLYRAARVYAAAVIAFCGCLP